MSYNGMFLVPNVLSDIILVAVHCLMKTAEVGLHLYGVPA